MSEELIDGGQSVDTGGDGQVAPTGESPAAVQYLNATGEFNREAFGELGQHSIFEKHKTPQDLAKAAINKDALIGKRVEELLQSKDPDIVSALQERRGVPKTAGDYEFEFPSGYDSMPKEWRDKTEKYLGETAKWAHEQGTSKELFEAFVARDLEQAVDSYQDSANAASESASEGEKWLKKEWRGNAYDNNREKSLNMTEVLEMEFLKPILEKDPHAMKEFFDAATKLVEDDVIIAARAQQSIETLEDQLADLDSQMMNFTEDPSSPEYQKLVRRKLDLLKQLPQKKEFGVLSSI